MLSRFAPGRFIERIEPRLLLSAAASDEQIVYSSIDNGGSIKIFNSNGTNTSTVPVGVSSPSDPAFSPDRTRIVFDASNGANPSTTEIWTIGIDGSNETRLTTNAFDDSLPHFSPDGAHIVFVSDRDGNDEIYSMDIQGQHVVRLTNNSADDTYPSYSPDGSMILFQSDRDGNNEIYTMNADGSNVVRRTDNAADDFDPAWSPEGQRIAFASNRAGGTNHLDNIFILDVKATLSGPPPVQITADGTGSYVEPTFSPDGTRIAVVNLRAIPTGINIFSSDLGIDTGDVILHAGTANWASAPRFAGYANGTVTVVGTSGNDHIVLSDEDANDNLNFTLNGKTETYPAALINQVQVYCGSGNDTVDGSQTPENIYAFGDAGNDELIGGLSNDTLTGGAGKNTLYGNDGNDRLNGSGGHDSLYGSNGNDFLYGNGGDDYLVGGAGLDHMWGGDGDDQLYGNSGNDKMYGEGGDDILVGGAGNDLLSGGPNADTLNGQAGTDSAISTDSNDVISNVEVIS